MSDSTIEVFVAAFGAEDEAGQVLTTLRAMDREGAIELIDAAVVVRRADGKVTLQETGDPSGRTWAKRGAVAGGLVGLIFPPGLLVSAAVGAAGGGLWGKLRDKGFQDADLRAVGDGLEPGTSAVIAVAEDRMLDWLQEAIEGYRSIARHAVSAEAAAAVAAASPRATR